MAQVLVLYNQPSDPAAFDKYYFEKHIHIAKRIPGLRSYTVSSGTPTMVAGPKAPYLIAELEFDSMAAIQSALGSPEGQATAADLANFAQAGATILAFETRSV
jgi:uncharacterized protein (TIGR02118 family)